MTTPCRACSILGMHGVANVLAHGGSTTVSLCWEHLSYPDAPAHPIERPCTDACQIPIAPRDTLPLVSVVTPTWGRHDLLLEAIENVRAQTYRPLEHVVVIDGQDRGFTTALAALNAPNLIDVAFGAGKRLSQSDVPLRVVELGRHWTAELDESYSAAPMLVAQLLARGDYQMWLSDDERMAPFHIELMVKALETCGVDFVYPRVAYYGWQHPDEIMGIGCSPPLKGGITTILYRREVINMAKGPYRTHVGRENDWDFIERAMAGGASHVFVDRLTFTHRDDRDCPPALYTAPIPEAMNA